MSLPSKSMRSVRALGVPCPRRSPGPVNNGKDFHISLSLSCDDSWYYALLLSAESSPASK